MFNPLSLFANGEQGIIADFSGVVTPPSDKITSQPDLSGNGNSFSQGTVVRQPYEGGVPTLLADDDLVPNPRFSADADWVKGTGWTISGGVAAKTAGVASNLSASIDVDAGSTYMVFVNMTRTAGTVSVRFSGGTNVTGASSKNASASFTEILIAVSGNNTIEIVADAAYAGTISAVSVRLVTAMAFRGARFDGFDNLLNTSNVDLSSSRKMTIAMSIWKDAQVTFTSLSEVGQYTALSTAGSVRLRFEALDARDATGAQTTTPPAVEVPTGEAGSRTHTIIAEVDYTQPSVDDQFSIRMRGVTLASSTSGSVNEAPGLTNQPVSVAATNNALLDTRIIMHKFVLIDRLLTPVEKDAIGRWVNAHGCVAAALGDSTTAFNSIPGGLPSSTWTVPAFIAGMESGGANIARAGDRISDQLADWSALTGKQALQAVFVQIGLNDINTYVGNETKTAVEIIGDLQDLIDTVNADKPVGCKTYVCQLTPCRAWLEAGASGDVYQAWLDVNEAIAGVGANPITGVDARIGSYVAALNDGSGNLNPIYDHNNDGVHPSNEGRWIIASAWRAQLVVDGLVAEGS
ncbi:GDSL-type esterase/lipase family protein [Flagellatimonas centrodinii]|uniref:SGNH/GDSL hydrolase family protein n=1 Tax=Flagellatimonas centrodinii TaxID=2806210 RepID=UPI001FED80F3|nr:GDSL-type esterase/lipase family protein [Flagellatimonas centrodinii]ULQ46950.1 GDSL-type esterase/lipase family protein [Flagellatimonas centrodinii]